MFWKPDPQLYPPYLRARIRRGKGVGEGIRYKSWLSIRDVPSMGTSSSIPGLKVQRPVHTLSELETTFFYMLERAPNVIDIREQWPIFDIDRTLRLCSDLGVRHAQRKGFPEPFTIDFLVTESNAGKISYRAYSIKTAEDAKNSRIRRRLTVEKNWCSERSLPWTLIDTSSFTKTVLATLRFIRRWFQNRYRPDAEQADFFAHQFLALYGQNITLHTLLYSVAKRFGMAESEALDIFCYCAWSGRVPISLHHPLLMNRPVVLESDLP